VNRLISWGEVRLGLRLIVKQPILSLTIILALATGICFATMGFTFREEIVNGRLPYRAGDRMARVFVLNRDGGRLDLDLERYRALRDRAASFEHVGAVGGRPFTVTHGPADIESIDGAAITPRSMRWLDAAPIAGRTLIPADGEQGAERVVVIRESLWKRRYSGDPNVVGRAITIGGVPLNTTATYRVTTNNFLADGGDSYSVFTGGTNRFVGEIDLDAFARYVESLGTVNPGPQNRITLAP